MTEVLLFDSRVKFTDKEGILSDIAFIFLDQLWQRTGGYQDVIDSIVIGGITTIVAVNGNATTTGNQRFICVGPSTITLNATPNNGEVVDVKRTNGLVTVLGNGRNIDDDNQLILDVDFVGVQLYFSIAQNVWIIT